MKSIQSGHQQKTLLYTVILFVAVVASLAILPTTADAQSVISRFLGQISEACRSGGPCTSADYDPYNSAVQQCNSAGSSCPQAERDAISRIVPAQIGTGYFAPSKLMDPPIPKPEDCSESWIGFSLNPICWARMLGALVASTFVWIGIQALTIAGTLFDYLLNLTVIQFGLEIYPKIKSAVETGWTVFRDIANILIIGMFTFIALSIILGIKEYGEKKLIARVLIIAVLINFSLLFTKIIIDASNFTAMQLHNAALGQVVSSAGSSQGINVAPAGATPVTASLAPTGISGQFMQAIGIMGFADSYNSIRDIQDKKDSGLAGIGFGILSLIYFLGAAIVLFYGSFLLVSRAILIIFLMLTSSLAFASYLVPTWETSSYGWKTWWDSLLKVAAFAPILMLLLWVTLLLAKSLQPIISMSAPGKTQSTLGQAATDPSNAAAAIFGYIVIMGMLFLSFKLSSAWASKISGFSVAGAAAVLPITLGSRLAGYAGRKTFGRAAARREDALGGDLERAKARAINSGLDKDWEAVSKIAIQKSKAGARAGRSFNMMNTDTAKAVTAAIGVKGYMAGANEKKPPSFAESIKARSEAAAKKAEAIGTLSDKQKDVVRSEAAKTTREQRDAAQETIKKQKASAVEIVEKTRVAADENLKNLGKEQVVAQANVEAAEKKQVGLLEKQAVALKDIVGQMQAPGLSAEDGTKLQTQLVATQAEHGIEMKAQERNIEQARAKADEIVHQISTINAKEFSITGPYGTPINMSVDKAAVADKKADETLEKHENETPRLVKEAGDNAVAKANERMSEGMNKAVESIARKETGFIGRTLGDDKLVAGAAAKKFKTTRDTASLRKVFEEMKSEDDTKTAPKPAPTPHP